MLGRRPDKDALLWLSVIALIIHLDPESQRVGVSEKGCRTVYWMRLQTLYALAIRAKEA